MLSIVSHHLLPNHYHLLRVGNPRLYEHSYHSPQLQLWETGEVEWHVIIRRDPMGRRHKRKRRLLLLQPPLFEANTGTQGP